MLFKPLAQALFMNNIAHKRWEEMQFDRGLQNV